MSFSKTLKVAWEGLMMNKVRSFLTTLGVIIGVAAVIIMLAVSAGAEADIADQINALGANLIMVMSSMQRAGPGMGGSSVSLKYSDLTTIRNNITGINGVSAEQNSTQDVKGNGTTLSDIAIVGTTSGFVDVHEYNVEKGRFITDQDNDRANKIAVLGYDIAQELFGDVNPVGQSVTLGTVKCTVVGVMEEKGVVGTTDYDNRVYVPITLVFKKFVNARFGGTALRVVYVSAESKEVMDSVMEQLNTLLMQILGTDETSPGFTMTTQDSIIDMRASTTETFRNLLSWVAAVSLVVGGIGIMNIMLVSVTERTREIGLRQALGARPRDVQLQFLLEAVMLSLVGGLVGVLAGVGGSWLFNEFGSMRTELVVSSIPLAFGAAAVVGIFFGYYPATQAAKLDPIVALRRE
ncbi:MAG TPA: ABC transporter permease [Anaerolineae bacterium]|nr:ABC transporter permease [Anaerolineae bacterium]HQH37491.1 ABC transporter permease [Anaerolineae bacterium]